MAESQEEIRAQAAEEYPDLIRLSDKQVSEINTETLIAIPKELLNRTLSTVRAGLNVNRNLQALGLEYRGLYKDKRTMSNDQDRIEEIFKHALAAEDFTIFEKRFDKPSSEWSRRTQALPNFRPSRPSQSFRRLSAKRRGARSTSKATSAGRGRRYSRTPSPRPA